MNTSFTVLFLAFLLFSCISGSPVDLEHYTDLYYSDSKESLKGENNETAIVHLRRNEDGTFSGEQHLNNGQDSAVWYIQIYDLEAAEINTEYTVTLQQELNTLGSRIRKFFQIIFYAIFSGLCNLIISLIVLIFTCIIPIMIFLIVFLN